jgi:hypothetical protein
MPKPSPIYVTGVQNISPMIQLLEQIAKEQYEIKALADNRVKVQLRIAECYSTIVKALAERRTEFHTHKLKEERGYRVVLKNMHYSINIKIKIEKLEHTVTNVWNIKQYRTKLPLSMFFVDLKPAPNNKEILNLEYIQQCKINLNHPNTKGILLKLQKIWAHQKLLSPQPEMRQMRR